MGLKLFVAIFLILIIVGNIIILFYVRGVNLIDKFRDIVLGVLHKYMPSVDPGVMLLLLSFVAIMIIVIAMLKVMHQDKA